MPRDLLTHAASHYALARETHARFALPHTAAALERARQKLEDAALLRAAERIRESLERGTSALADYVRSLVGIPGDAYVESLIDTED